MASSRCDPARSVADVSARRARRGRGTARRNRLGDRISQRRVAAAQATRLSPRRPAAPARAARLRFDRITQLWLRELGKRWTRLRLTSGLSIGAARAGVDALICFSDFLTLTGVDTLADVDRPLLERYLAHVMSQPGGHGMKKTRIGSLNLFFQNDPPARLGRHAARHRGLLSPATLHRSPNDWTVDSRSTS